MDPNKKLLIALIFASTALGAIILSLMCLWNYLRKNSLKSHQKYTYSSDPLKGLSLTPFMSKHDSMGISCNKGAVTLMDYNCLKTATEDFRESNVLGVGGFGCVYKARLEENNHVAVKRLNGGTQDSIREFETEVDLLGRIQHPNIISLLGYSIHGETRLLVYELMQNGSLETQLHGPSHGSALNWHQRMKIALDTARGLEYLHEHCNPKVIHRDLKSSNILLDSNFNAKLSDFGLAVTAGTQKKNIKLSGTLGYVAPEYLLDGKLTDKSDVYAFGVVLLELLLGRKHLEKLAPAQCQSIVTWAMPQLTDRSKLPSIVDPVIKNTMDLKHLYQVAAVAVLCVQQEPSYRPLITDVLHSLIPLIPVELGGALKIQQPPPPPESLRDADTSFEQYPHTPCN
ncbi:protein kinase superfamily protein [Actinidia rufa]|uniref:Protein kinase superfamily protein n=1 Tax=Actinidia rufa TaxID=165716 RepID=A0A7J0FDY0_9ERIC|nr:protein kinase superfamily protein [Actinidia rufa]